MEVYINESWWSVEVFCGPSGLEYRRLVLIDPQNAIPICLDGDCNVINETSLFYREFRTEASAYEFWNKLISGNVDVMHEVYDNIDDKEVPIE